MPDVGVYLESIGQPGSRRLVHTPSLVLDLDSLANNAQQMSAYLKGNSCKLRPHAKAHKCGAIARLQMEWGAEGLSCANLNEAEAMAAVGISSILVTSPIVTTPMIERLIALASRVRDLIVVADNPKNVTDLSNAAHQRGVEIGVLIDIDVGQHRTGVVDPDHAIELAGIVARAPGIRYQGLQAYYGHLQHIESYSDRVERVSEQMETLRDVLNSLERAQLAPEIVSGGGTGTFHIDIANGIFTELQVGSYLLMDIQYSMVELTPENHRPFEHSLFVEADVVSTNQPGLAVVNGGWKAFSTEDGVPRILDGAPEGAEYRWMGDEHGGLRLPSGDKGPELGDRVRFIPYHCDPTVNLYRSIHCVRGDTLIDVWPITGNGY